MNTPAFRTALAEARHIAVFRALQLGDMLCAVPALRALRAAAPQARISLIGLPNAAGFVARYGHYLDELVAFPGMPGMPEQTPGGDLQAFYDQAAAQHYDIAIQLHGSGQLTNPIVARLGARHTAGFLPEGPATATWLPWPDNLPEILRYTALMAHLGIEADDTTLEFPLNAQDQEACAALLRDTGLDPRHTVLFHPGARLPSRRWPAERFAEVASHLHTLGWQIAVTGTEEERPITQALLQAIPAPAADLTGRTSLGSLAALVAQCRLVVCNDTGISHVAAAMGTPSVVVASGSDNHRWAPLNHDLHVVVAHAMPCRPCMYAECPLPGHPCASSVTPNLVQYQALRHLAAQRPDLRE